MLNFKALDSAYSNYRKSVVNKAHQCSIGIKAITQKFTEINVNEAYVTWSSPTVIESQYENETIDINAGIYWDNKTKKIMVWFDSPHDATFLAGETADLRAAMLPRLQELVDKVAVEFSEEEDEETDDESKMWEEGPNGEPSEGDAMMTNGVME